MLSASNGKEVIAFSKKKKKSIDLILSDIVMPVMGGPEMVRKIVNDFPDIKVLFMSGYLDDSVVKKDIPEGNKNYIQKPFSSKTLLTKIRELLDNDRNDEKN